MNYKKEYKEAWTANHYNLENYKKLYPKKMEVSSENIRRAKRV